MGSDNYEMQWRGRGEIEDDARAHHDAERMRETLKMIHEALPDWRTHIDTILEEREPWLPKRDARPFVSQRSG